MPRFKEQAICIRHIDWSETSQIVALLTAGRGIIRAVAKGAKRTSPGSVQRFSGGIELLTLGQAVGMIKPAVDLANLTEWDLQEPFWQVRHDLAAQRLGLYAADLVGAMLATGDPHPNVFTALHAYLESLCGDGGRPVALLRFQWALLGDCGYQPELQRDVHHDAPLAKARSYTFDAKAGGLTTRITNEHTAWQVRRQTVDLLRTLNGGGDNPTATQADDRSLERANRLLCVYARAILDRELPTMRYVLGK